MDIFIGIILFILFFLFLEQYVKVEEERDKKKAEAEAQRSLELQRLHNFKLEKGRIALEVYKAKLLNQGDLTNTGLNKNHIVLWSLFIIFVSLIVFIIIWSL